MNKLFNSFYVKANVKNSKYYSKNVILYKCMKIEWSVYVYVGCLKSFSFEMLKLTYK